MDVDDRQHEESEFHIYPQPHRIRSKRYQDAGEEPVSPSLGSLFTYSGTFHFADLLDLSDIEGVETLDREKSNEVLQRISAHRNEIRNAIKDQVKATLVAEVFGGEVPHGLNGRNGGGWIMPDDAKTESTIRTDGGALSATQHLDLKVHLFHKRGDNPEAILAKTTDWIANLVARQIFEEFGRREEFVAASFDYPELFDPDWHNQEG